MPSFTAPAAGRSSSTLDGFLGRLDDVRDEADGFLAVCPAHADGNPSLRIAYNADKRSIALRCRAGCETTDVVKALGLGMRDLFNVEDEEHRADVSVSADKTPLTSQETAALTTYLKAAARRFDGSPAAAYALRRFGVTLDRATSWGLGYDDGTVPAGQLPLDPYAYHRDARLVVPFRNFKGVNHYLQGRALKDRGGVARWSGASNPRPDIAWGLYNFIPASTGWDEVLVTEGPGDGYATAMAGYDSIGVRGASLGSNDGLADEIAAFVGDRPVVVVGDNDTAGQRFMEKVSGALGSRGVDLRRLRLPDGVSDPAAWHERSPSAFPEALVRAVRDARSAVGDEESVDEILQDLARIGTDVYNARVLMDSIRERGGDVKFTDAAGFLVYTPEAGVWGPDRSKWVRQQAQSVSRKITRAAMLMLAELDEQVLSIYDPSARETAGKAVDSRRKKVRSGAVNVYVESGRGIDAMLKELEALPGVYADFEQDFDQHHELLAVKNGVVNLETGHLRPFTDETKELHITRKMKYDYVPGATNPRWERFLAEVFVHRPELVDYAHRLIGYGITGETTNQCLPVWIGEGANGKKVVFETIKDVFSEVVVTTAFSTFEQKPAGGIPNDIARLKGSRIVLASEGEQGKPMAESLLKTIVGGDTITARFMRREFFEFQPTFLVFLATNHPPTFRGQDYGLWRRVRLLHMDKVFKGAERDDYLEHKLRGRPVPASAWVEGEDYGDGPAGIMAWAIRGAMAWYAEGLKTPDSVMTDVAEFQKNSDVLAEFYGEFLVREDEGRISGKEVFSLYVSYCDDEMILGKDRLTRSRFFKMLEERGAVKRTPKGSVSFNGIRARTAIDRRHDSDPEDSTDLLASIVGK